MNSEKCQCPFCQADISEFVREMIKQYNQQQSAAKARAAITPEIREKMTRQSCERLQQWKKDNPERARASALNASHARTAESFARQRETVKETARKKSIKFAELLFEARTAGREITPEVETELMAQAAKIVKEENKQAKKNAKKAEKPQAE